MADTWIYFVQAGSGGPIKIGKTANFFDRFTTLQVGNHESLVVLRLVRGARTEERSFHTRFAAQRIRGEWFRPEPALLIEVFGLPDNFSTSFRTAWSTCSGCGDTGFDVSQTLEGLFVGYCRRCKMTSDGRTGHPRARYTYRIRRRAEALPCNNCRLPTKIRRQGLCGTCAEYYRRTGRTRKLSKQVLPCSICGDCLRKRIKSRCTTCYVYWRRTGNERLATHG